MLLGCKGLALLTGNPGTVERVYQLVQNLNQCAHVSGLNAPCDWLSHIFRYPFSTACVFCDGSYYHDECLEIGVYTKFTDACDYFSCVASELGLTVVWGYRILGHREFNIRTFYPVENTTDMNLIKM